MEDKKLFDQIKSAADNAETKDFPGMENVWHRLENKLDKKEDRRAISRWKKIAIAASLLLMATLGYQFFKNDQNEVVTKEVVHTNDSIQKTIQENVVVAAETLSPEIKKDAAQILEKQINPSTQVAVQHIPEANDNLLTDSIATHNPGYFTPPLPKKNEEQQNILYAFKAKRAEAKDIELFFDKSAKASLRKEEPLVIIDDKVSTKKLQNIEFTEADSLVVLKEPLYIINGVEYTEQEVFGPNPTSPYTPLNKQEIESFLVLQDEKAVELYGKKGKKGVVIITTKNGKPASASKKVK
ncbi:hypothetical protein [Flavobacterium sp.]